MKKKGAFTDNLIPWIIVIILIILMLVAYGIYSGKLQAYLQYFKDLLKVGR